MKIENLIDDYKKQTKICSEINYLDKDSVKKNNKAIKRMYQIVELISNNNSENEITLFSELLINTENRTNLWSAIHLLEKLDCKEETKENALEIIEKVANGNNSEALGFKCWIEEYKLNLENGN